MNDEGLAVFAADPFVVSAPILHPLHRVSDDAGDAVAVLTEHQPIELPRLHCMSIRHQMSVAVERRLDRPADAAGQSIDDDAQGLLSAGPRGRRVDDGAGPGVPAGLSDTGDRHCADGTPMAAVGARPPAERDPDAAALGRAAATATAGTTSRGASQGPPHAEPDGGAADGG